VYCAFELVSTVLPTFTGEYLLPDLAPWNPRNVAAAHISHGRFMFLLQDNATISTPKDVDRVQMTKLNIILGLLHAAVYLCRSVTLSTIRVGIIMSVSSLWGAVYVFCQEILGMDEEHTEEETAETTTSPHCVVQIEAEQINLTARGERESNEGNETNEERRTSRLVARYKELKALSDNMNESIGGIVLFFIGHWTMYYSNHFNKIFLPGKWNKKFRLICGVLRQVIIFCFSTSIYVKVSVSSISRENLSSLESNKCCGDVFTDEQI